uniref:Uncharacterized protein n=1 Tax=Knipowitschia caucasica TaxID=637954 RepID=A0AAV2MQ53_KNICA
MGKEQDLLAAVKSGDLLLAHKLLARVKGNKAILSNFQKPPDVIVTSPRQARVTTSPDTIESSHELIYPSPSPRAPVLIRAYPSAGGTLALFTHISAAGGCPGSRDRALVAVTVAGFHQRATDKERTVFRQRWWGKLGATPHTCPGPSGCRGPRSGIISTSNAKEMVIIKPDLL